MKMTQFANFANNATKQILGDVGLVREDLTRMFDYSLSFIPFPDFIPNVAGVKFIDYDGTVIYFIPRNEVLNMDELPPTFNHKSLIAQGWNWSLEDIKTYMNKYPNAIITVGQTMIPYDGKTHMVINMGPRLTIPLMIQQTVSEGVTINWGDGSEEETIEGTGAVTTSHTYETEGEYEITLDVADGCTLDFGGTVDNTDCNVFGESTSWIYISSLKNVYVGKCVISIGQEAFSNCYALSGLTIPDSITSIGQQAFSNCNALTSLLLPNGVTSIGQGSFANCYALTSLSLPNSVTSIKQSTFAYCYALTNLALPDSVTSIGLQSIANCSSLTSLTISDSVTSIVALAFTNCYALTNLTILDSVTSIGVQAFSNCRKLYSLTILAETPPTLANVNAFNGIPSDCTIYVPNGKGDTYKAASGWSTWASQIQELPE